MEGTCRKSISADVAPEVSTSKREVTSYKAIFGNVDRVREIVEPGAFLRSIGPGSRLSKGLVPTRHNHETLVGKMIHAEEDSVGLLTVDKYAADPVSDRIFGMVRDRIIETSSFTAKFKPASRQARKGDDGKPVYHLTELDLIEAGPADPDFAVNPETRVVAVKGLAEVSQALASMNGLDSAEAWTMETLRTLSPEDRDALLLVLSQLPVGLAVETIIAELRQGDAVGTEDAAMGKALQLSEAYEQWQYECLSRQIERISRRLCTAN